MTYPGIDLAGVSTGNSANVVLQDGRHCCLVSNGSNPVWQLRVPHKRVTTDKFAILRCVVDQIVRARDCEFALDCFGRILFHAFFWRGLAEISVDELLSRPLSKRPLISTSTVILLSFCSESSVEATGGGASGFASRDASVCA